MSREDALKKLSVDPIDNLELKKEISFICNKLDISNSELFEYFNLEKKTFMIINQIIT